MVGIVWFQQIVYFPLFRYLGRGVDPNYFGHQRDRMTMLTFPIMTLEFLTAATIFITAAFSGEAGRATYKIYGLAFFVLLGLHMVTFQMIRPMISKLSMEVDEQICRRLVRWNWTRTMGWTVRAILLFSTIRPE
jgi:hypothetical protein